MSYFQDLNHTYHKITINFTSKKPLIFAGAKVQIKNRMSKSDFVNLR